MRITRFFLVLENVQSGRLLFQYELDYELDMQTYNWIPNSDRYFLTSRRINGLDELSVFDIKNKLIYVSPKHSYGSSIAKEIENSILGYCKTNDEDDLINNNFRKMKI